MRRYIVSAAVLGLLSAGALNAQTCTEPGYPVEVMAEDGQPLDSAFLASVAQAVAYRWVVPSVRRNEYLGWRRVRERTLPAIPRWADDWRPGPNHNARVTLVLRKRGRPTLTTPPPTSGDPEFNRSLASILREPMPGSPDLPSLPGAAGADSVALTVSFGFEPDSVHPGVLRFAAEQTPVTVIGNTLQPQIRRSTPTSIGGRQGVVGTELSNGATVKYDVTEDGRVDMSSFEVVDGPDREMVRAIRDALATARFQPATTNCQSVRITVVQRFGDN